MKVSNAMLDVLTVQIGNYYSGTLSTEQFQEIVKQAEAGNINAKEIAKVLKDMESTK